MRSVIAVVALISGSTLPSFAAAQTLGAVEQRLDHLEKAVRQIERDQASRRTRSANADDAYLRLDRRLEILERAITGLVSTQERGQSELASAVEQLQRMKRDVEFRLDAVENRPVPAPASQPTIVAVEPVTNMLDADGRFEQAMTFAERREWSNAEFAFDTFIASYPSDERIAIARYQLGRALQAQGKNPQGAQIFLDLYQKYPDAPFALDNLFALGAALSDMGPNSAQQACDVYGEIETVHGSDLSVAQRSQLLDRRLALHCSNGSGSHD